MKKVRVLHRLSLWVVVSLLLTGAAFAQTKSAKIDALIQQYVANRQFNGSVLVADKGQVIFKKGYGLANMEWNIPNAPDTKFRLGSITKQFTAMLIMQLVEKKKLSLTGKITDYLPDYPKATGDKITIHHLLTHTSGIPNYTNFPKFFETLSRDPVTPESFTKEFSGKPLDFEPGTKFSYSNSGYFLLGTIIEKVTGKSYADVLTENILKPAQMANTGYDLFSPILPKRATGYEKKGSTYVNSPYLDMSIPYAAGSMYSTVEDLYRWDQVLYTDKLLSASGKATMYTPFIDGYAYGWGVGKSKVGQVKDSLAILEHGGGINGFNTIISRLPKDKQLVVLLNNTGGAPLNDIRKNILRILYDQPVEAPKMPIADLLRQSVLSDPLEKTKQKFTAWKADKAYSVNENEINALGYELMREGKDKEALAVFNLNTDAFPESYNVYDSRGEIYMKMANKAAAIQDYKRSVALNPRNTNGFAMLKELGETVEVPKQEGVVVDKATLESYVGDYQLAPGFSIVITREGDKLYGQATGQGRFELFPESKTKFYLKVVEAQVSFVSNDKGEVEQLILHQNGQNMPGKRLR
ncbi:serine hydrolase [Spirosoma fluviale]|uniref:CubicO group peptidase, beta-lactamase class C family n=1 Tax=Spirosoma fluviale TaxID=1597977 RepID=A0A286F5Y7_9BACT|nr:serine hydrolase [Spirosoma fluviale]SOD78602.1 CubicO group peptidase, beta-lactamase class C family [Spirosoma fluviale]